MRDSSNVAKIKLLHPKVAALFQSFIEEAETTLNITLCIVQGLRTFAEQQALYEQGRTKPGPVVTWSPAGASYHNYGLAIDVCPYHSGNDELDWDYDFIKLLPAAEKFGLTWGGNFPVGKKDRDHFENKMGYNWRDLLHKYIAKDFIAGTTYVNL